MVLAAKRAYKDFPTVVNEIPESGLTYDNNLCEYARMDNIFNHAQKAIGGSSDTAQLALSYYFNNVYRGIYNEDTKHYYDIFVILAVLAQCAIDGCKRLYAVDVNDEIKRIRSMQCMSMDKDYPKFMKYTSKIPSVKNGKPRSNEDISKDKSKVENRIDNDIICPMNWMQENLEKIQMANNSNSEEIINYFSEKPKAKATSIQMNKIRKLVEGLDNFTRRYRTLVDLNDNSQEDFDILSELKSKYEETYKIVSSMKISFPTMYRLVESSLGYDFGSRLDRKYKNATKYTVKLLNVLYHGNKTLFLQCFSKEN